MDSARHLPLSVTGDGKAYFKYLNLFECAITVGPVDPQRQWCLADVKFLHMAKQSVKGRAGTRPVLVPGHLFMLIPIMHVDSSSIRVGPTGETAYTGDG